VVSASDIDRGAVRLALDGIPGSSLVIAGTREKLRVHMHVDAPALLFETLASFGEVRAAKADDMHAQQRAVQANGSIAVVVDSAADLPGDSLERLSLHVVPVRINAGSTDYLDKVSLSAQGFYALLRDSDQVVRTSQPPPGDFRRLFEFLLSHHAEVLYVGVSRAISGTLQSGESAGAVIGFSRARIRQRECLRWTGSVGPACCRARSFRGCDADGAARAGAIARADGDLCLRARSHGRGARWSRASLVSAAHALVATGAAGTDWRA
jgi:hypothetical protein